MAYYKVVLIYIPVTVYFSARFSMLLSTVVINLFHFGQSYFSVVLIVIFYILTAD